jgi:hypothetical protein
MHAYFMNYLGARNLFGGQPATLASGPTVSNMELGPAVSVTGGSSFNIPYLGNIAAGDFTWATWHFPRSWPGTYTVLVDRGGPGSRELSFFIDTSGNQSYYGIGLSQAADTTALGMTAGKLWFVVYRRIGTTVTMFVNGVNKGQFTASGVGGNSNAYHPRGENQSGGGSTYDGLVLTDTAWTRGLSDSEAWALWEPSTRWDLYWQPSNRVYINTTAAATGVVGKSLIVPQANVRASYW